MVRGLYKYKEFFKDYSNNYLLIGGVACERQMENAGLNFRATKDLDIVLIVEAYSADFVRKFWEFVKEGAYEIQEKSSGEKIYYRFKKPGDESFPWQLELFSRKPEIKLDNDARLTPIPLEEDVSSLSAILLHDDYYNFTMSNVEIVEGLSVATTPALICLKASAYLDLKKRKQSGEQVDNKNIKKHRNDIVRLAAILADEVINDLPGTIKNDLEVVLEDFKQDPPDIKRIGKDIGVDELQLDDIINQLEKTFLI